MKSLPMLALAAAVTASSAPAIAAPAQGGTLTVPVITTAFTKSFNPYIDNLNTVGGMIFEPLAFTNVMQGETSFRLAESYEYAEDYKSITYTLRDDLQWSDGEPLTAEDVVYTFDLAGDVAVYDLAGVLASGLVTKVTKVSEREVRFDLAKVDSTVHWDLNRYMPLPKHVWEQAGDPATFTNPEAVGSGPVTEIKYVRPQQMEICRNPHYYQQDRPYLDCIKYRAFNDNSQIQPALMSGEIDWGSNFIADVDKTFVATDPANHHYWYPANDAIHLYFNTEQAPFDDLKFRQAVSVALDREAIVDLAAYGYPTANFFPGGIGDYFADYMDESVMEDFGWLTQYDPEKAKALLDEAGYQDVDGDGQRELPDGSELSFDIDVVNGWTDWVQTVLMITEYLQDVGINANVNAVEWGVYDQALKDGDYQAAINWSLLSTHPIQTFKEYYHTSRVGQIWHAGHGVHAERVDALIEDFGSLTDQGAKQDTLDELQRFTAEQLPFVPLFSNATWFQYNTSEFVGWPNEEDPYVHPVFYSTGNNTLIFNNLHQK
ncbi:MULTISPECIES: ABC transporter substrate-binding protein [Halomonadaceae]|uniref:ABC transporter substrate-binding protein n=1 Tax=Halomonadaceae TaxID=28256 RepID=UPI0015835225|nr:MULTISPECIES: ABC transporter substrate-binding protein [Halomonas]MDI4636362.1 ABC transporter substrate-binding protein [Halomonas sp. BMC7]NUJ60725.1 ABC transporter substrate-binding protein [Halomonas taeanensis]|tara:strand:+ start:3867 stop:5501 length:1635 start_codon:yes stop_codon:yes gene_type:complete